MAAAAGKMIFDGVLNFAGAMSERNFAKAQYKTREAEIAANKVIREANNKAKAAYGSLARYRDVLSKKIAAKNYGNLQGTLATNLVRTQDHNTAVRQYLGIQEAENNGALAASVAASGIGGNTVDQLQRVSELRFATRATEMAKANAYQAQGARDQMGAAYESFVNGQGVNYQDDGLSFIEEVNQETVPSFGQQLFKAAVKTVGANYSSVPDMFSSPKVPVPASKGLFNFDIQPMTLDLGGVPSGL